MRRDRRQRGEPQQRAETDGDRGEVDERARRPDAAAEIEIQQSEGQRGERVIEDVEHVGPGAEGHVFGERAVAPADARDEVEHQRGEHQSPRETPAAAQRRIDQRRPQHHADHHAHGERAPGADVLDNCRATPAADQQQHADGGIDHRERESPARPACRRELRTNEFIRSQMLAKQRNTRADDSHKTTGRLGHRFTAFDAENWLPAPAVLGRLPAA